MTITSDIASDTASDIASGITPEIVTGADVAQGFRPRARDQRARIIEVAAEAMLRLGPRRLTLVDVAALAGISRPTLYRYFASKEDLLEAIGTEHFDRLRVGIGSAIEGLHGRSRLEAALAYLVKFQVANSTSVVVSREPGYILDQMREQLPGMIAALIPLIASASVTAEPAAIAALIARLAISHALFPAQSAEAFLLEMRTAARLT